MVKDHKFSCTSQLGAEILMVFSSFIIAHSVLYLFNSESFFTGIRRRNKIINDQDMHLFLSSSHALFLPLMSYLFSEAKQYNLEGRAQVILIWMVLIEIIRIRADPIFHWGLRKSAEQLVRLFWVVFLVCSYTPLNGIRVSLLVLCIYFAFSEVLKGIVFNEAKVSYLIGKNPKLIHNYMKRIMAHDDLRTTPMNSCDYIVTGEDGHEITVCSNGYNLGNRKANSEGMLTIGRVFQINSSEDEVFTSAHPDWRDTCLSLALAKMLRRRFAKLPVDEAGCPKALDFVLEGLIDYIGSNQNTQTDGIDEEGNLIERVFCIIETELKFVSEFLQIKVQNYYWFLTSMVGVGIVLVNGVYLIYTISQMSSVWLSLVAQEPYNHCFFHAFRRGYVVVKIFSGLDLAITILLVLACMYLQYIGCMNPVGYHHWTIVTIVRRYIKDPAKWNRLNRSFGASFNRFGLEIYINDTLGRLLSRLGKIIKKAGGKNVKKARVHSSILDVEVETIFFCMKVDASTLACLPKWFRGIIPTSSPTVVPNTDAKEAILRSLRNSEGRLTNGETSLENYGMKHLKWACQPNGSTTEAILVWHIATTLFHHQEPSPQEINDPHQDSAPQQNNDPHQEPAPQQNNIPLKEQQAALALSSYCLHLVKYFPDLLPDEPDWTDEMIELILLLCFSLFCLCFVSSRV